MGKFAPVTTEGGVPEIVCSALKSGAEKQYACCGSFGGYYAETPWFDTEEEAVNAWNNWRETPTNVADRFDTICDMCAHRSGCVDEPDKDGHCVDYQHTQST